MIKCFTLLTHSDKHLEYINDRASRISSCEWDIFFVVLELKPFTGFDNKMITVRTFILIFPAKDGWNLTTNKDPYVLCVIYICVIYKFCNLFCHL